MRVPSVTSVQVQPSLNASSASPRDSDPTGGGGPLSSLGVSALWRGQLGLLGANLAACGGIVGLSRLLPKVAEQQYDQHSHSAVLMFVVTFGLSKALCNLLVGALANSLGRRALLQAGWAMAALVPLLLWFATSWTWILWATGALGASQGFCTSGAVVMLMDIVPARARGVAMGALECTIYVSLGMGSLLAAEMLTGLGGHRAVLVVHGMLCAVGAVAAWRTKDTSSLALQAAGAGDAAGDASSTAAKEERAAARSWRRGRRSADRLVVSGSVSDFDSSSDDDQLDRLEQQRDHSNSNAAPSASAGLEWNSLRGDSAGGSGGGTNAAAGASSGGQRPEPIALASTRHGAADSTEGSNATATTIATASAETPNGLPTPGPSDDSAGSSLQQRSAAVAAGFVVPAAAALDCSLLHSSSRPSIGGEGSNLLSSPACSSAADPAPAPGFLAALWSSVVECSRSAALRAVIQAGFLNNFKDGVAWGLFPAFFAAAPAGQLGALLTAYPLVWGLGQLVTGRLSDKYGRGRFVWGGLALQGAAMALLVAVPAGLHWLGQAWPWLGLAEASVAVGPGSDGGRAEVAAVGLFSLSAVRFVLWLLVLVLLGLGTAMSYPVLQAYIGDVVAPSRRASAIGLYRLCRDLGYAFGGVLSGRLADAQGVDVCLLATGALLGVSALYAFVALPSDEQASKDAQKQAR